MIQVSLYHSWLGAHAAVWLHLVATIHLRFTIMQSSWWLAGVSRASLVAQRLKRLPAMQETWVRSLGWEDPLEKEMATHSSILAWRIPWTGEPGRLQPTGSQRVGHDWVTSLSLSAPTPGTPWLGGIHFDVAMAMESEHRGKGNLLNFPASRNGSIICFPTYCYQSF